MLDNLTKEIFYYSVIPVAVIAIIVLILLLIGKKKENDYYKYNYSIKIMLIIIIGLVLPLITGYTIWIYERFTDKKMLNSNILYMLMLVILIVSLISLLIIVCTKLLKSIDKPKSNESLDAKLKEF